MRNPVLRTLMTSHLSARPWRWPADESESATANMLTSPGFDDTLDAHLEYRFHDGEEGLPAVRRGVVKLTRAAAKEDQHRDGRRHDQNPRLGGADRFEVHCSGGTAPTV